MRGSIEPFTNTFLLALGIARRPVFELQQNKKIRIFVINTINPIGLIKTGKQCKHCKEHLMFNPAIGLAKCYNTKCMKGKREIHF